MLGQASRKALRTFVQTFTGAFSVSLFGWVGDVQQWADGSTRDFPSVSPLGKAATAALVGAVAGLLSYAQNRGEQATGVVLLDPAKASDAPTAVDVEGGTVVVDVDPAEAGPLVAAVKKADRGAKTRRKARGR